MTPDQQQTWDALKGFQHPLVNEYYMMDNSKFKKYMKIQKALNNPQVSFKPDRAVRTGPGGEHDNWKEGIKRLGQHLPARRTTIPSAIKFIEDELKKHGFKRIKWGKMSWAFRPVTTRYGLDIGLGADVLIEGVAKGGLRVCYFYDSTSSAEGAHRYILFSYKDSAVRKTGFNATDVRKAINVFKHIMEKFVRAKSK